MSPAHSTSSIERYLETPLQDEAIPSAAIGSLMESYPVDPWDSARGSIEELKERRKLQQQGKAKIGGAGSVAGSDSSVGSRNSMGSWTSQNSAGSRGSRRGRRNWVQTPSDNDSPKNPHSLEYPPPTENPNLPWYCTSPECKSCFRYRSEWDRHEAAVHHWPYHWVCNLGDETSSVHKDADSRIFYRQDQLMKHMKTLHPGAPVTRDSTSDLRRDNPDFDYESLRCGFCFMSLSDWEERQHHVAKHIQGGMPKFLCWKLRPPQYRIR